MKAFCISDFTNSRQTRQKVRNLARIPKITVCLKMLFNTQNLNLLMQQMLK